VFLGLAGPADAWCDGCRWFALVSDGVQASLEDDALREARLRR